MVATCEALMGALYAWLADYGDPFDQSDQVRIVEALGALTPGSWPVPCLDWRGLPTCNAMMASLFTLEEVAVPLAGAIWRFEVGAREVLAERAVVDPHLWRRRSALLSLGAWWPNDQAIKPLLERVAGGDSDGPLRGYAMMLLVQFEEDHHGALLLSQRLDAAWPGIDPSVAIGRGRVRTASQRLGVGQRQLRATYERLADRFGLRLAWRA